MLLPLRTGTKMFTQGPFHGTGPLVAVVMGVITGSVGGIVRDVVGGEPSIVLRREVYVTASALGAASYVVLIAFARAPIIAAVTGFLVAFVVRGLAIAYNLSLPVWRGTRADRD